MDYLNSKLPVRNGKIFISIPLLVSPHLTSFPLSLVVVCARGLELEEELEGEKINIQRLVCFV